MTITNEHINQVLAGVIDPDLGRDYVAARAVKRIEINGTDVSLTIELGYPARSRFEAIRQQVEAALTGIDGIGKVKVSVAENIVPHAVQGGTRPLKNVKNVIAVASGKGGVGKSTTAVNLALALAAEGARVGLLDADIYGPSQPAMMGLAGQKPLTKDGQTMEPLENYGVQVSSVGFMIDPDEPMIWRGPMVSQALQQLVTQTNWHELDYLIIDMPPGTGDIQLTLAQKVPVTGAVIVTTPQDIALLDAKKGLKMFEKVGIPILGIVENMSVHVCSNCGHAEPVFGTGGGEKMCAEYGVDFLGALPLALAIREQTDAGKPTVVAEPDGAAAKIYRQIARRMTAKVALRPKDLSGKLPPVVVAPA
ncbi:MAG: iron-sulfur cluster carrier protein ApbC [Burkholderiaceae bacterium]|nr:iron-sulfur cluster carrier protein ApbC [Burkholderiaceae bacterium]